MSDYDIAITMTAVRRRKVLQKTLESFYTNLLGGLKTILFINVDPIGDEEASDQSVWLAKNYVDTVVSRTPDSPDFGLAWHWTWTMARKCNAPWILHLEDDWQLMKPVKIKKIFSVLKKFRYLALLRFSLWPSGPTEILAWDRVRFVWNGCYFHCPPESMNWAYCGHPSIIKRRWLDQMFPLIDPRLNPEKQFRRQNQRLVQEMRRWDYGLYQMPNEEEGVREIGRSWRDAAGYLKIQNECDVGHWVKKE
jgi:hypothetical protein